MSARVGAGREFVVEADEYDTAFFDKRSQVRALPADGRDPQQPRIRPRRHLPGRRGDPAPVPPPRAHRAAPRPADRQRRGRAPGRSAGDGLLDAGRNASAIDVRDALATWRRADDVLARRRLAARFDACCIAARRNRRGALAAARPAQRDERAGRARGGARGRRRRRRRAAGARALPQREAPPGSDRRGATASPSTTTSRTTRPRSRPRSPACARGSATRASSWRWSRAAIRCAWARMPTRSRRRCDGADAVVFLHRAGTGVGRRQGRRRLARRGRHRGRRRCADRALRALVRDRRPRRVHVQRRLRRRAAALPRVLHDKAGAARSRLALGPSF